jgi:hypothetical protein
MLLCLQGGLFGFLGRFSGVSALKGKVVERPILSGFPTG